MQLGIAGIAISKASVTQRHQQLLWAGSHAAIAGAGAKIAIAIADPLLPPAADTCWLKVCLLRPFQTQPPNTPAPPAIAPAPPAAPSTPPASPEAAVFRCFDFDFEPPPGGADTAPSEGAVPGSAAAPGPAAAAAAAAAGLPAADGAAATAVPGLRRPVSSTHSSHFLFQPDH